MTSLKFAISCVVLVVFSVCVPGQGTNPVRTGRPDTVQREQQRQVEKQIIELALATEGRQSHTKRYSREVLEQIRSDFLQIQVADRKLVKAVAGGGDANLKLVSKLSGEIHKRSRRLKGNLELSQPLGSQGESVKKIEEDNYERLRASQDLLSNLIESFVSNPMFEHSKILDQALSDKAWQDLTAIIQLSDHIKRSSERLRK